MDDPGRLIATLTLALALSAAATPLARRLAVRTEFFDHPRDYKAHFEPTPYLGGLAVVGAFGVVAVTLGNALSGYGEIIAGVIVMTALGTLDDRIALPVAPRMAVQITLAAVLWRADLGWDLFDSEAVDLALTVFWVVGICNATNMMDNQDGIAAISAGAAAIGIGLLASERDAVTLAAIALGLGGACLGFLPHNLTKPATIFLGDGGSMAVGFALAALTMALPHPGLEGATLFAAVPLLGIFVLDTSLVVASRIRRGVPVFLGGRDHLSHRCYESTWQSTRRVAAIFAVSQAMFSSLGIALYRSSEETAVAVGVGYCIFAIAAIAILEAAMIRAEGGRTPVRSES